MAANDIKVQAVVTSWFTNGYSRLIRFLSRRLQTPAEVEDLAQEVFLRLLRVERVDLVRNPQAYLHEVAANAVLEWQLRARQRRPHSSDALDLLTAEDSPEQAAAIQQTNRQLRQTLRELPPISQAVLVLRAREDLTNEQIAARLNLTRRTVKRHLETGYAYLRARLAGARIDKEVLS